MKLFLGKQNHFPSRFQTAFAVGLVAFPAVLFYAILLRWSFNLPLLDDYHALLHPVNQLRMTRGDGGKILYLIGAQHNEYKLWLDVAAAWLQEELIGRLDFRTLSLLGDSFVLGISLVLWKIFSVYQDVQVRRLLWFAPASWMLFQLSYAETLNWSMAALQNLPVILFSLLTFVCLQKRGTLPFLVSLICMVVAISASGNGLLVIFIGAFALILQERYKQLLSWSLMAMLSLKAYTYNFNVMSSQAAEHRSIFLTLRHLSPVYVLAVMGSIAGKRGCIALGAVFLAVNVYLSLVGYFRANPLLGYCTLFVFLTAIGIGGIRSELGLDQAISSRYRIYSVLLLIFCWFAFVERMKALKQSTQTQRVSLVLITAATVLFALKSDRWGYRFLHARELATQAGMQAYRRSLLDGSTQGPVFLQTGSNPDSVKIESDSRNDLQQARQLGTYLIPD